MAPPRIVRESLPRAELASIASEQFGDMVKAVVDVDRGIMALDDAGLRSVIRRVVTSLVK